MQLLKEEHSQESDIPVQDPDLRNLKDWMQKVQPVKLIKLSEDVMTQMLENWSKFRITILKTLNEQENRILDCMGRLRKQVQWLNQVKLGQNPEITKITTKLLQDCLSMLRSQTKFELKAMLKQSKLISDKILDSIKTTFEGIKQKIGELVEEFKEIVSIKEVLTEKTYFRFLQKKHHSEMTLLSSTHVTVDNQSHEMDFGAVIGPALTQSNYRIGIRIDRNDKYQSFMGVGVCHPEIVKENYYKGTGIGSGCYIIRQQSNSTTTLSLSHAYEKEGTHKRLKYVPWGFGEGDMILIEMDFKKKTVGFSKGDDYYEMKVDLDEGSVYPYVVLHSRWDCAAIINQ